jgi:hypothetical protein
VSCEQTRERLSEAAFGKRSADASDRVHAEQCRECGAHARFLENLVADLDRSAPSPLHPALLATCREGAVRALRARRLPASFAREVICGLGVGLLALPLILAEAVLVGRSAASLLAPILPEPLFSWLAVLYLGSLALGLGLAYGSIPLAVALTRRRLAGPEVS